MTITAAFIWGMVAGLWISMAITWIGNTLATRRVQKRTDAYWDDYLDLKEQLLQARIERSKRLHPSNPNNNTDQEGN